MIRLRQCYSAKQRFAAKHEGFGRQVRRRSGPGLRTFSVAGLARHTRCAVAGLARRSPKGVGGFTLVELLVVISLLTIVVGLLTYPLIAGFTFLSKGKARQETNSATRFAMTVMTRELSNAIDVILVPSHERGIVFVLPNMSTYCPEGEHWLDGYQYYCPQHLTANVEHELIEPVVPMRNADGDRVAIVYYIESGGEAAGHYLARAVAPFPAVRVPGDEDKLQQWGAWDDQLALPQTTHGALTPTGEDFKIPCQEIGPSALRFAPTAVENEVLTPYRRGGEPDYSIYLARYPLWKPAGWTVEVRDSDGNVITTITPSSPEAPERVDVRSGTVSFAKEETVPVARAAYLPDSIMPPALGPFGPIVRGTEVVLGPPHNSPFLRTAVVTSDRPPVFEPLEEAEYWIDYDAGLIYVSGSYAVGNPPPAFSVRFMRQQTGSGYSVIASYQTYALLNIDLTVRKTEVESGKAGPEGVLGLEHDFHVSGKVKLVNVAR